MPELDGGVSLMPEQALVTPLLEAEQMPGIEIVHTELADQTQAHETAAPTPEMPTSHGDIDPTTLTTAGLIKVCKHFADIAARDPALAASMAERVIESKRQEVDMQQRGMDSATIKSQKWAMARERHKQKVKAAEKPEPEHQSEPELTQIEPALAERADQTVATATAEAMPHHPLVEVAIPKATVSASEHRRRDDPVTITLPAIPIVPAIEITPPLDVAAIEIVPPEAVVAPDEIMTAREYATSPIDMIRQPVTLKSTTSSEGVTAGEVPFSDDILPAPSPFLEQPPLHNPADTAEVWSTQEVPVLHVAIPETPAAYIPAEVQEPVDGDHILEESRDPIAWDDVLEKEPAELYDDFTEALQILIAAPELKHPDAVEESIVFPDAQKTRVADETQKTETESDPLPPIAITVAERLDDLADEKKETVAPMLQEVVIAVQIVEALHIEEAAPEIVEAAMAQLEEQVVALFEEIGIAYDAESVEQFARVLLRPDFQPVRQMPATTIIDLEHQGTHEVKQHFAQIVSSSLADVEYEAERMLGELVLLYSSTQERSLLTVLR